MNKRSISRPTKSLLMLSGLCSILFLIRFFHTSEMLGFGLIWNLFLAWVPLFFALVARRYVRNKNHILAHICIGFWLLFFPNAPYIITDFVHLSHLTASLWWFDSLGIFITAMTGLILGIYSLSIVHHLFEKYWGVAVAWLMVFGSIFLSGFGIYLGRFSRFNSWDLFTNPVFLLQSSIQEAYNPLAIKLTLVFTLVLFVLYVSFRILNVKTDEYH